MNELCVEPLHCLLDEEEVRSSVKTKSLKEEGVEVDIGYEVTIAESGVELESEKNKEDWERELDMSVMSGPGVRDGIAKADKFVEQKVVTASLSRIA